MRLARRENLAARTAMGTDMKAILTAMGVAALASPAMAQTWRDANVPVSTDNVFWGLAYAPLEGRAPAYGYAPAYGSAAPHRAWQRAPGVPGVVVEGHLPRILDCVHVTFPQCSAGAGGN
jgi:hypothetical protein